MAKCGHAPKQAHVLGLPTIPKVDSTSRENNAISNNPLTRGDAFLSLCLLSKFLLRLRGKSEQFKVNIKIY
jgi:hypothetical protein